MRRRVLAALLATGLAGPAFAAIDLGPIPFGFSNRITVPLEAKALGAYEEELTFTVTGAPKDTARLVLSARSPIPENFERQQLGVLFLGGGSALDLISGGGPAFRFDPTASNTFELIGEILGLPASYQLQVAVTPIPATALLASPIFAAFGAAALRRRQTLKLRQTLRD
jgi:hypothetical protein